MAARRWLLFGLAMGSLVLATWAGVLLAFSIPTDGELREHPRLAGGDRALVVPVPAPEALVAFAESPERASFVATGARGGSFPSSASNVSYGLLLAHVAPGENATAENLTLVDVPTREGPQNVTLDLAQLGGGAAGLIVLDARDGAPRFVPPEGIVGDVLGTETTTGLWVRFGLGLLGFFVPLVALVVTHRGGRRAGAPALACSECRAPLARESSFCLRCGAWLQES